MTPTQDGWRCPGCGRIFAPFVPQCTYCPAPAPGFVPAAPSTPVQDCGCPLNYVCMSVVCPRRVQITS